LLAESSSSRNKQVSANLEKKTISSLKFFLFRPKLSTGQATSSFISEEEALPNLTLEKEMIMSKLTLTTQKKLLATAVIVTLGGVAAAVSAAPTLFDATATVQNAVTITEVTPLHFGTVFVTKSAATSATGTAGSKLTLASATGVIGTPINNGVPMLSLGSATAGSYTVPGLPPSSSVGLTITNATATGTFNNAADAAAASCGFNTSALALAGGKIVLSAPGGDPNSVTTAFFCIDALTANVGATNVTATLLPIGAGPAAGFTLGFGATSLAFNLGGTLVQQVPSTGVQRTYEPVTYTGQIGMEIFFL
jgi:hypothetical protein